MGGGGGVEADDMAAADEVFDAERRGETRRADRRQNVARPGDVIAENLACPRSDEDRTGVSEIADPCLHRLAQKLEMLRGDVVRELDGGVQIVDEKRRARGGDRCPRNLGGGGLVGDSLGADLYR